MDSPSASMVQQPSPSNPSQMASMEVEESGQERGGDDIGSGNSRVENDTQSCFLRLVQCWHMGLFVLVLTFIGSVMVFLGFPFTVFFFFHFFERPKLAKIYLVDYQRDGKIVKGTVTGECTEAIPFGNARLEKFTLTVEYLEEQQPADVESGTPAAKWRKEFAFFSAEAMEAAIVVDAGSNDSSNTEGGRTTTIELCYPPGRPQAALPKQKVERNAAKFSTSTWCNLCVAFFCCPIPLFMGFVVAAPFLDLNQQGIFWVVLVVWVLIEILVGCIFCCVFSPLKLHRRMACKSAELVNGEDEWPEGDDGNDSYTDNIISSSLASPLLSAVFA